MKSIFFHFQFRLLCVLLACTSTFLSYTSSEKENLSIEQFNNLDHDSFLTQLKERQFSLNEINQLLYIAIERGSEELTDNLINKNANVNTRDKKGFTPLFTAALNGAYACAATLVAHDAQLGSSDRWATIFEAIINSETRKVGELLQGTNIHESEHLGFFLLHAAVYVRDVELIDMLLNIGSSIDRKDNYNNTPLHMALEQHDVPSIKRLIHRGADVNSLDEYNRHPLYYALHRLEACTESEQLEVLRILLAHGARLDADIEGMRPLHTAAQYGRRDMIRCLIEAGANKDGLDTKRLTPLIYAVEENELGAVKCLIELGANSNARDRKGFTSLHHAVRLKSHHVLEYLLDNNANKDAQTNMNRTPLDQALAGKKAAACIALLTRGSSFNQPSAKGRLLNGPDEFISELLWGIQNYLAHPNTPENIKNYFHALAQEKIRTIGARKKEWLQTNVGRAWHLVHNITSSFYQEDYHQTSDPLTQIKTIQKLLHEELPRDCVKEVFAFAALPWQTITLQEKPEWHDQGANTESCDLGVTPQPTKRNSEDNNNPRPSKRPRVGCSTINSKKAT